MIARQQKKAGKRQILRQATLSVLPLFLVLLYTFVRLAIKFTRPTAPVSTNKAIKIKCQVNKSKKINKGENNLVENTSQK